VIGPGGHQPHQN